MDNDPKHITKATQKLSKKMKYSSMESVIWPQPDWTYFLLAEDKTEGRKTHKQADTSGSKGLAKDLKGRNSAFSDAHAFQT